MSPKLDRRYDMVLGTLIGMRKLDMIKHFRHTRLRASATQLTVLSASWISVSASGLFRLSAHLISETLWPNPDGRILDTTCRE